MDMRTVAPQREVEDGLLPGLGRRAIDIWRLYTGLMGTLMAALKSPLTPGVGAREVCRGLAIRQIFYTSFQALGMVCVIALLVGATLVAQTELLGGALHRETAGRVMVAVILREIGPLVTAIIVAGRSGTAIATAMTATNLSICLPSDPKGTT